MTMLLWVMMGWRLLRERISNRPADRHDWLAYPGWKCAGILQVHLAQGFDNDAGLDRDFCWCFHAVHIGPWILRRSIFRGAAGLISTYHTQY